MRRPKVIGPLEVTVMDDLERSLKILKKKMALEGLFKELKKRRHYEPPSVRRRLKKRKPKEDAGRTSGKKEVNLFFAARKGGFFLRNSLEPSPTDTKLSLPVTLLLYKNSIGCCYPASAIIF